MGQVVHWSATEPVLGLDPGDRGGPSSGTAWSRDLRTLSKRYGIKQKTCIVGPSNAVAALTATLQAPMSDQSRKQPP